MEKENKNNVRIKVLCNLIVFRLFYIIFIIKWIIEYYLHFDHHSI